MAKCSSFDLFHHVLMRNILSWQVTDLTGLSHMLEAVTYPRTNYLASYNKTQMKGGESGEVKLIF